MIRIIRDPIDSARLLDAVRTDATGGLALFVGTVRSEPFEGRVVTALEYEAYDEMALRKMEEIGAEMRRRWPIEGLAIEHRIGRLSVGEASVAVAVATGHRAEAFEACRFGIDTLKKTVPIWKKEIFADGEGRWVLPTQS